MYPDTSDPTRQPDNGCRSSLSLFSHISGSIRDAGAEVNIEAYANPAMLQDPWAALMQQYLQPTDPQQPDPSNETPSTEVKGSVTGRSMSEAFEAAEQVRQSPALQMLPFPSDH